MTWRFFGRHWIFVFRAMWAIALNAVVVFVVCGLSGYSQYDVIAAEATGHDLRDIEHLPLDLAETIVREQAKKPLFLPSGSAEGINSLLTSVGLSADQIVHFNEVWKSAQAIDGQTLTAFLARTTDPECQAVANKFSFFLHLPAVKSLEVEPAAALAKHVGVLSLAGLETLDPEVARALAKHKQGLLLYGLKDLSVETALALAQCEALGLRAITTLDQPQASALATQRGLLNLSGVQTLHPEAAAELGSNHQGVLHLPRLESLSTTVAEGLASHRGELHLAGVASLSPEAAAALGRGNGDRLVLTGLKTLERPIAEALAPYPGVLVVRCPQNLESELAATLAQHEGGLFLTGFKTVAADTAIQLSRTKKCLCLQDVGSLDPDAARELSKCPNQLSLPAITALTPEVASQLAKNDYALVLEGLDSLDAETAAELARCRGALHLPALQALSVEAARELAKCRTNLHLAGLRISDPNLADALARCEAKSLTLGLTELSPQIAQRLARCSAELHLPNLQALPEQVAEALARHEKGWLVLRSLRSLSREAARELSMCRGNIDLSGLDSMTPEVAAELAKSTGTLNLNGLKTLSPDVAAALAKHEAPTVLQGVTQLSEDAALAFADCPHVVFSDSVRVVENTPPRRNAPASDLVAGGATESPDGSPQAQSPQVTKEPAETARSVTDIMDSPEDYVNGTYTIPVWLDMSLMDRAKEVLNDGTEILDGYCLRLKDGTRDARTAESLGRTSVWPDEVVPVIRSKTLARGLQDALPRGSEYRLNATVTIRRIAITTTSVLAPDAPPRERAYLLMDITRLEAKRSGGAAVVVDEHSTAEDFAKLRAVFEKPPAIAAKPEIPPQPASKPSGSVASPEKPPRPAIAAGGTPSGNPPPVAAASRPDPTTRRRASAATPLDLIPPDSKAVGVVYPRVLFSTEFGKNNVRSMMSTPGGQEGLRQFAEMEAKYGFVFFLHLTQVIVAAPMPRGEILTGLLVILEGEFDRARIEHVLVNVDGLPNEKHAGVTIFQSSGINDSGKFHFAFISDSLLVGSMELPAIREAINRSVAEPAEQPLSATLTAATESLPKEKTGWIVLDPTAVTNQSPDIRDICDRTEWLSLSVDAMHPTGSLLVTMEANSPRDADALAGRFREIFFQNARGEQMLRMLPGGISPASESIRVHQNGRRVVVSVSDLR